MNIEEAVKIIESKYIFTTTEVDEALRVVCEKQVGKKVEEEVVDEQEASGYAETCPSCHKFVFDNYCANCGQKLDWSE